MAISITLNFDDTWAARLAPMVVAQIEGRRRNPLVQDLIAATPGVDSVDDLTTRQKAKLWILLHLLRDLSKFEGQNAAEAANIAVTEDIRDNFPLEFGGA